MTNANRFKPQSEADRHQGSYRPVEGSQRADGNYTQTRQATSVEDGMEPIVGSLDETNMLLRAIVHGLSLLTDTDLLEEVNLDG